MKSREGIIKRAYLLHHHDHHEHGGVHGFGRRGRLGEGVAEGRVEGAAGLRPAIRDHLGRGCGEETQEGEADCCGVHGQLMG